MPPFLVPSDRACLADRAWYCNRFGPLIGGGNTIATGTARAAGTWQTLGRL